MNLQTLRGMVDYWSQNRYKFYPWGFAMNGQTSRLEATRQMIFALDVKYIVETGTFRGTTTEWFGQFAIPIETVEFSERFFHFSKTRLAHMAGVRVVNQSSIDFLKERISSKAAPRDAVHLFYLDAHGASYLPLREELQLIFSYYSKAVVLIDDFKVEGDEGYNYDDYGPGKALTLDYVESSNLPTLSCFFPAIKASQET